MRTHDGYSFYRLDEIDFRTMLEGQDYREFVRCASNFIIRFPQPTHRFKNDDTCYYHEFERYNLHQAVKRYADEVVRLTGARNLKDALSRNLKDAMRTINLAERSARSA